MRLVLLLSALIWTPPVLANSSDLLRCAAELKLIHPDEFDSRIFAVNGLLLGSARMGGGQVLLFISNERTTQAYEIKGSVTRFHVEFPHSDPRREWQTHFFHYTHSDVFGSRLSMASVGLPPQGKALSDFHEIKALAMPQDRVRRQIIQLIANQIQRVADLHRQGKLNRSDLLAGNLSLCRGLGTGDRTMAKWLESQIGELELASTPVKVYNRAPASFK